jgi:hypothetical protein
MKYPEFTRSADIFSRLDQESKGNAVATLVERDEDSIRTIRFELSFTSDGAGFSFPCDSKGRIFGPEERERSPLSIANEALAKSKEWDEIEILPWTETDRLCSCGSGLGREGKYDARGFFLTYTCPQCEAEKLGRYRKDVLYNPSYEADEAFDED